VPTNIIPAPKKKSNKKKKSAKPKNNGDGPKVHDVAIDTHADNGDVDAEDSDQSPVV
jgi:hypothetical protein